MSRGRLPTGLPGALLAPLLALASCGWHAGLVPPEGPDGATGRYDSIGVEMFGLSDAVLERDLEPELHDQLTRSVSDLVDLELVSPARADLVIRGRLLEYSRRGGIRSPENIPLETAVRVTVEASLVVRATGDVLATSQATIPSGYVTAELLTPPLGLDEDTYLVGGRANELPARERALRYVADSLVLDLFAR